MPLIKILPETTSNSRAMSQTKMGLPKRSNQYLKPLGTKHSWVQGSLSTRPISETSCLTWRETEWSQSGRY